MRAPLTAGREALIGWDLHAGLRYGGSLALLAASACTIDERDVHTGREQASGSSISRGAAQPGADAGLAGASALPPPPPATGTGGAGGSDAETTPGATPEATPGLVRLSVGFPGDGKGNVRIDPPGNVCQTECSFAYTPASSVTLLAMPLPGSSFSGWSSEACAGTGSCGLELTSDTQVLATFTQLPPVQLGVVVTGQGRVTSTPAGIDCPGTCSASFEAASTVVLHANPIGDANAYLSEWGGSCSGLEGCSVTLDPPLSGATVMVSASFAPANFAFVTSTSVVPGALGGLAQADQLCQQRATAGGLPGRYVAWLSTSTTSAVSRVSGARGWIRPDGREFADSIQGLLLGKMFSPLRVDELGRDVTANGGDPLVLTGTQITGMLSAYGDCASWTDPAGTTEGGVASAEGESFTQDNSFDCATPRPLYCFGVDRRVRVEPLPAAGRLAFLSSRGFTPGAGIGAADAVCQASADAVGLPGSYLAKLATSSAGPATRFDLSGPPWVRLDGVPLAPTAEQYFSAPFTSSSPTVTEAGTYLPYAFAWYGLSADGTFSAATTCRDWSSSAPATGSTFRIGTTKNPGSVAVGESCDLTFSLICLQQ
jgi:hypothetical protein